MKLEGRIISISELFNEYENVQIPLNFEVKSGVLPIIFPSCNETPEGNWMLFSEVCPNKSELPSFSRYMLIYVDAETDETKKIIKINNAEIFDIYFIIKTVLKG